MVEVTVVDHHSAGAGLTNNRAHCLRGKAGVEHDCHGPDSEDPKQRSDEFETVRHDDEDPVFSFDTSFEEQRGEPGGRLVYLGVGDVSSVETKGNPFALTFGQPIAEQVRIEIELIRPDAHDGRLRFLR